MTIYDLRTNRAQEAPMTEVKHPNNYTVPNELYVDIELPLGHALNTLEFNRPGSVLYQLVNNTAYAPPTTIRSVEFTYKLEGIRLNPMYDPSNPTDLVTGNPTDPVTGEEVRAFQLVYRAATV